MDHRHAFHHAWKVRAQAVAAAARTVAAAPEPPAALLEAAAAAAAAGGAAGRGGGGLRAAELWRRYQEGQLGRGPSKTGAPSCL